MVDTKLAGDQKDCNLNIKQEPDTELTKKELNLIDEDKLLQEIEPNIKQEVVCQDIKNIKQESQKLEDNKEDSAKPLHLKTEQNLHPDVDSGVFSYYIKLESYFTIHILPPSGCCYSLLYTIFKIPGNVFLNTRAAA